jgi:hypothetical protein
MRYTPIVRKFAFAIPLVFISMTTHASSLELSRASAPIAILAVPLLKGQIPQSRVARGEGVIIKAYLSSPTRRYDHGVLGDKVEAAALTLLLDNGKELIYELPPSRVFEDLEPRLFSLDHQDAEEVVVVESDLKLGASLAVYGLRNGRVVKLAATPFLGHAHRWLNPVGAGDFNGDSLMDLALVATPHIGGVLELYSYTPPDLTRYASMRGVSTHSIGNTALGMGTVVKGELKDLILVPSQQHDELLLLEWVDGKIVEKSRLSLPAAISGDLVPTDHNRWMFRLESGSYYTVKAVP